MAGERRASAHVHVGACGCGCCGYARTVHEMYVRMYIHTYIRTCIHLCLAVRVHFTELGCACGVHMCVFVLLHHMMSCDVM